MRAYNEGAKLRMCGDAWESLLAKLGTAATVLLKVSPRRLHLGSFLGDSALGGYTSALFLGDFSAMYSGRRIRRCARRSCTSLGRTRLRRPWG